MEERQNLFEAQRRCRRHCSLCGGSIEREDPFYSDEHESVHLFCFFESKERELTPNERSL